MVNTILVSGIPELNPREEIGKTDKLTKNQSICMTAFAIL